MLHSITESRDKVAAHQNSSLSQQLIFMHMPKSNRSKFPKMKLKVKLVIKTQPEELKIIPGI